jgi:WD40 repeat protein
VGEVSDHELERHNVPTSVSFSPNGRLMATATKYEREVKLWDADTSSHIDSLFLDPQQVGIYPRLLFSPDSSLILSEN